MEEKLKNTIKKLQATFKESGLNFDGGPENFWQMLNDLDVQKSIAEAMSKKIKKAESERNPVRDLLSGRFHC